MVVDFGGNCQGEDTVRISENAGSNVRKGGSTQGRLWVLREGRTGSVESSLGRRERPPCLSHRGEATG